MSAPSPAPKKKKKRRTKPYPIRHWRAALLIALAALLGYRYFKPQPPPLVKGYVADVGALRADYARSQGRQLESKQVEKQFEKAAELTQDRQFGSAAVVLEELARQAPLPVVYTNLGLLYEQQKEPTKAMLAYRQALARDAGYVTANTNLERLVSTTTGPLSAEVEPNDTVRLANPLGIEQPMKAEIQNTVDLDFYRLAVPPPPRDRFEISIVPASRSLAPWLRFVNQEGIAQPESEQPRAAGETFTLTVIPSPRSTMFFKVSGDKNTTGAYTLTVRALKAYDRYEPNDDIFSAHPIAMGEQIEASIMDPEDTDFYSFVGPRKGTVSIHLHATSASLVPALTTFTPDKRTSGFGPDADRSQTVNHTIPVEQGETYYLQIWSQGKTAGGYSLKVE